MLHCMPYLYSCLLVRAEEGEDPQRKASPLQETEEAVTRGGGSHGAFLSAAESDCEPRCV